MPEQSHLDEMRDKIRGDRERAARRAGTAPPVAPRPAARIAPTAPPEPVPTPPEPGLFARVRRLFERD
jgi:hypothetical protein